MFRTKNPPNPKADSPEKEHHKHLYRAFENFRKVELEEFRNYLKSPWKIFWANFLAGTARGLGLLIGATIVIALVGFIVKEWLSRIPIVGEFFLAIDAWIEATVKGISP